MLKIFCRPIALFLVLFLLTLGLTLAQRPELQRNSAVIHDVQQALIDKGYDPGPLDGIMGPLTRAALERFQKASGLPNSGQMTDATLNALGVEIPVKQGSDSRGGVVGTVGRAGETAGRATASGATTAGKATAKGATVAGKSTAKAATVAGKSTAKAATVAGKSTAKAGTTAGKATAEGVTTAGRATAKGAKAAGSGAKRLLFGGDKLKASVEEQLKEEAGIDLDDVEVKVNDGVVTLRFKRGTQSEWNRALRVVRSIEGVTDVKLERP